MTPEQQRIAIAEACGWKNCHATGGLPCGQRPGIQYVDGDCELLPNYLNDLNAMHDAEKVLTGPQRDEYYDRLMWFGPAHFATAAQRAKAFLRTLNIWTE